jgi:nicotinamidase-related amidase
MTSQPIRDQVDDHLLTPKNSALLIIDYQPLQVSSIVSMDRRTLVANIVAVAKVAKLYALPIVLSTVNVKTGANAPTIHQVAEVLAGIDAFDRTTINAWEDEQESVQIHPFLIYSGHDSRRDDCIGRSPTQASLGAAQ